MKTVITIKKEMEFERKWNTSFLSVTGLKRGVRVPIPLVAGIAQFHFLRLIHFHGISYLFSSNLYAI